jgi:hypothetical protein
MKKSLSNKGIGEFSRDESIGDEQKREGPFGRIYPFAHGDLEV